MSEEEVEQETKRIHDEIDELRDSAKAPGVWKKLRQLEQARKAAMVASWEAEKALDRQIDELSRDPAAEEWNQQIAALSAQLNKLNPRRYELVKESGRRLLQSRHEELRQVSPAETPNLLGLGFDALSFPRVDGSTSTQPLAVLIACRYFNAPYGWVGRDQLLPLRTRAEHPFGLSEIEVFFRAGRREPELTLLEFALQAKADQHKDERLALIINGLLATNASTPTAYRNLIEGRSDIGLLARRPSETDLKLADEHGVELEIAPCALDAFVFLVNDQNPVKNLTLSQIRAAYSGKTRRRDSLGGAAKGIVAYQREENSGSQELMRALVMKDVPLMKPTEKYTQAPQLVQSLMSHVYLALTDDEYGLGYSVYYYEHFMAGSPRTRVIAVDGVEPNYETIRDRTYPLATEVFVVTRAKLEPDAPAARLRDWLLSSEGQSVVRESGYVPLNVDR